MKHLDHLLAFVDLTHRFQQTKRVIHATGEDRMENDAEHSYQLALVAWYLAEKHALPLNKEKLLQYALVHDLVEAYAGDTYFYRDAAADQKKKEAEHMAAERIAREFPDFPKLHETLAAYEKQGDDEAKFLYSLDKLLPVINIYKDGGRSWKAHGVTLEMTAIEKSKKITDPLIAHYLTDLLDTLAKHQDMFATPNTNTDTTV